MSDAVTPGTPGSSAPAAGDELLIPKHRFDEKNEELRRAREEIAMKDQLYARAMAPQQQQPQKPRFTAEELGIDPQTFAAVAKLSEAIAEDKIAKERAVFESQIGYLSAQGEKTSLLATKGADKAKYLPEIQRRQIEHQRTTGGFLPAEIALTLIQADEKDDRIRRLEAQLAGQPLPQAAGTTPPPAQTYAPVPNAAATRQLPNGGSPVPPATGANRSFSELTLAEMEARLQEQFSGGQTL